ncbi:N-acetyltransferase family protein [Fusibacter bizertensis]
MKNNKTSIEGFEIRFAVKADVPLILNYIKELADYEQLLHEVVATEAILEASLFEKKQAEVIIAEFMGEPVGFALFFHNFSTFLGKANLYLEDLYVTPAMRGKGFGKIMLAYLGKIAVERGCGRLDWWCLDWNKTSIAFYKEMGAVPMDEWTVYRVEGAQLIALAKKV